MLRFLIILSCCVLLLAQCKSYHLRKEDARLRSQVATILSTTPVVDTHIDFPWSLVERNEWYQPGYTGFAIKHNGGQFDFERAVAGGLYGPFMSIYIPAKYQLKEGRSREVADSLITMIDQIVKAHPSRFALAPKADDVIRCFKQGIVALPMGMENGSPIDRIEDVAYFHRRGIRYITLTHGRDNKICDSSYDTLHTNNGLSPFGREVVKEMNRVGIMVDVSHLSDKTISDVLKVAKKPLIASHSGCRHFTPDFQRNLPDSLIIAVAKTGGVIQVPFSHYFLASASRTEYQTAEKAMKAAGIAENTPEGRFFMRKELRNGLTSVRTVANQIDYLKNLVGIDHVGIGSDFDGVGLAVPLDLADVSMYPNLMVELLRRGDSESDIRKVCSENILRAWRANE